MYNNLDIAKTLNGKSFLKSVGIYKNRVRNFTKKEEVKDYLGILNTFLYTYFLTKYKRDLSDMAFEIKRDIQRTRKPEDLIRLGEIILKRYRDILLEGIKESEHDIIEGAILYINSNFTDKITLKEISDILHISKNYLCHLFKEETGYKFCEYVNIKRVSLAKEMIRENKKNFEFISFYCGFSSQSHFSTTFKKYTGVTPNEFRTSLEAIL